jgi:hypothetical protein
MRIELRNGGWAEVREEMNGGDRRIGKAAIHLKIAEDGSREMTGELEENVRYALLRRLIVGWSYPPPLPKDAVDWVATLDNLHIDDIETLAEFVQPFQDRVLNGPKSRIISGNVLSPGTSDDQE